MDHSKTQKTRVLRGYTQFRQCSNLIKKPWAFMRVPYMNPIILGGIGPGFLNQVRQLSCRVTNWR